MATLSHDPAWDSPKERSGQKMENIEVYLPIIYEAIERPEPDSGWRRRPPTIKRNLYWSKRSSNMLTLMTWRSNYRNKRFDYTDNTDNFPTLPFSTIIRNINPAKKNGYFRVSKR